MKKDVFVKGTRLIITSVFFVSMFFTDRTVRKVIAAVIILWLLIVMVTLSIRGRKRRHGKTGKTKKKPQMGFLSRPFIWEDEPTGHPGNESPAAPLSPSDGSIPKENIMTDGEIRTMKQHIALRIADKLKSAYPASVWQWTKEPTLKELLSGITIRIAVENMDKYTHADICFDRFGCIHVEPMTIGEFASASPETTAADERTDDASPSDPSVVDVRVWYELIGQKVLNEQISSLNAKGHSMLSINEKGDILVKRQKSEAILATLESFPSANYWKELVELLTEDGLKAKIAGSKLQVSWI